MSGAINIPPPLTCGCCGALVDERQAWPRFPAQAPECSGDYLVMLQPMPHEPVYIDIARWDSADQTWSLIGDLFGLEDCPPLAWRHLPPLPEWIT